MTSTSTAAATSTPAAARTSGAAPATPSSAPVGRRTAVVALVVGAALNTAEAVLGQLLPERPDTVAEQLRLVAENSTLYTVRAVVGTLAVPFMAVAFLAASRVLAARARRAGAVAGALLLAGMWGFLGIHVLGLLQVPASRGDVAANAAVLQAAEREPLLGVLFLLPFLAGVVLGLLVLTVGMLRTGVVARWIPAAWLAFLALDFTVGSVGPVDPHWLFLAGAVGLAAALHRSAGTTSNA